MLSYANNFERIDLSQQTGQHRHNFINVNLGVAMLAAEWKFILGAGTCSLSKLDVHLVLDEASRQKRIGVRFVPKGHLTIAHGFQPWVHRRTGKSPGGTAEVSHKTRATKV